MRNSTQKTHSEIHGEAQEHFEPIAVIENSENVVEFLARSQLVAQQAEEACHLEGNLNAPDFDAFEEKYGLLCFA